MRLSSGELYEILLLFREHLIPCWERYHAEILPFGRGGGVVPEILSKNACRHTSAFI